MATDRNNNFVRRIPETREALWAMIGRVGQRIEDDGDVLAELVYAAREHPEALTWEEIGEALGISRQAAWERFTHARLKAARPRVHQEEELPL